MPTWSNWRYRPRWGFSYRKFGPEYHVFHGVERMVLDERPAHAGGPLRPQRDVAVALVDEVVHLLGDHVGRLADAREHPDVLEQRGDDLAVAGGLDDLGEHGREASPACGFRRQDVAHPRARLEFRHG